MPLPAASCNFLVKAATINGRVRVGGFNGGLSQCKVPVQGASGARGGRGCPMALVGRLGSALLIAPGRGGGL